MIVLGSLKLACGIGAFGLAWKWHQLPPEMAQAMQTLEAQAAALDMTGQEVLRMQGGLVSFIGALLVILGIFVRRGSRGVAIASIVIAGLLLLLLAYEIVASLGTRLSGQMLAGLCVPAMIGSMYALLLGWLIQAVRAAPRLRRANEQWQAMWWQYMQQQQRYMQGWAQGGAWPAAPPDKPGEGPPSPPPGTSS
jgi:hypothetical protein